MRGRHLLRGLVMAGVLITCTVFFGRGDAELARERGGYPGLAAIWILTGLAFGWLAARIEACRGEREDSK
ncbi:hypothetical protein [Pseudogemmobacter sonorensis]|uniref:hypothetical protein n=1 Tax=Pseudogemmobacter sonorensis TaxID=2989681 RepID=UPI0036B6311F